MLTAKVHRGPILKRPIKKILFLSKHKEKRKGIEKQIEQILETCFGKTIENEFEKPWKTIRNK